MRHRLISALGIALVVLVVACSGGDDDDGGGGDGGDGGEAAVDDREAIEADVRSAHDASDAARRDSAAGPSANPELPAVSDTHTGPALAEWVRVTTRLQTLGMALRYPERSQRAASIDAVDLDDDAAEAILEVCTVSDGEVYLVSTGQVVSSGLRTTRTNETMVRQDETWRLSEREVVAIEDGATCAD
jgi:hypothetical protein